MTPGFFVIDCRFILAEPLGLLINLCLKSSIFPSVWKKSRILRIYKSNDPFDVESYGSISILYNFA